LPGDGAGFMVMINSGRVRRTIRTIFSRRGSCPQIRSVRAALTV